MKDLWGRPLRPGDFVLWSKGNDHWDISRVVEIDPARGHHTDNYRDESAVLVSVRSVSHDDAYWEREFEIDLKGARSKPVGRCWTGGRLLIVPPETIPPKALRALENWR